MLALGAVVVTDETYLVGEVVRAAVGKDVADYLSEKMWSRMGMDSDGYWLALSDSGPAFGGMCFSGTLRDYARLGLFHLAKGTLPDGTKVLPEDWMGQATTPSATSQDYGYFWWLSRGACSKRTASWGRPSPSIPVRI